MKFNIYPQEFPALSRYLLRFADSGRFRTSLSAVQSAARDVGELPASLRGAAFRQIAYAPARETQKYRIFVPELRRSLHIAKYRNEQKSARFHIVTYII